MTLNSQQLDILTEIVNIGVGKSAGMLNKLLNKRVMLNVPSLRILTSDDLLENFTNKTQYRYSSVNMPFKGEFQGVAELVFPTNSAQKVLDLIINESAVSEDLDLLRSSTLNEIGNIILNSLIGTLANLLKSRLRYSVPSYSEGSRHELMMQHYSEQSSVILANTNFKVKDVDIVGTFLLYLEFSSFQKLIDLVEKYREQYT